jgi:hypothetical protein
MAGLKILLLVALISSLTWFNFFQPYQAGELWLVMRDWGDPRPARQILMLGNSRTYFNGMPEMLRHVADSDGAPQKYEVADLSGGGASLESLWGEAMVQRTLGMRWDEAVVQSESRAQSTPENAASFNQYGQQLLQALHPVDGPPKLVVNWAYDLPMYPASPGWSSEATRAYYFEQTQKAHARLAQATGAHLVNVGQVWEYLRMSMPELPLTSDGNHPTPAASYFYALCLYADLSGKDVARVRWAPDDVAPATAASIREVVDRYRSQV